MTQTQTIRPPDMVNEVVARLVAAQVALVAGAAVALGLPWLAVLLVYDFAVRVAGRPALSPFARLATRVLAPALGRPPRLVPAAPKRFAQAIGLAVSTIAVLLWLASDLGAPAGPLATTALAILVAFATLEAALAFCAGCWLFAHLTHWGILREPACETCVSSPGQPASATRP